MHPVDDGAIVSAGFTLAKPMNPFYIGVLSGALHI